MRDKYEIKSMRLVKRKKPNLVVGDTVNYHSVIGAPVTSTGHIIKVIMPTPNSYGRKVAWVTGISGCVAYDALSAGESQ